MGSDRRAHGSESVRIHRPRVTAIHVVLSDDWELYGDGSGDMRKIQFANMRQLRGIYEEAGLRASFNAEVMQQLYHEREGERHPRLRELAREWRDVVCDTYSRGHDVQLHVHPQWHEARYVDGQWLVQDDWTLGHHPPARIRAMIATCKQYLENLLTRNAPDYRCVAFRAGAWALVPSEHVVPSLIDNGISLDVSIAPGLVKTGEVDVDYSRLGREFLPYYPQAIDARLTASAPQPLVCVPTFTFDYTPAQKMRDTLAQFGLRGQAVQPLTLRFKSFVRSHTTSTRYVADLSALNLQQMHWMLQHIRQAAAASRAAEFPVVLTNHTKDLTNFEPIRAFAKLVAAAEDISVITLAELASNIQSGRYPIRVAAA